MMKAFLNKHKFLLVELIELQRQPAFQQNKEIIYLFTYFQNHTGLIYL